MTKTKKQHFVPQFYLNKFTDTQGNIHVFDKPQKKTFVSNTRDIANEPYFFDTDDDALNAMIKVIEDQPEELIEFIKQSVLETNNPHLIQIMHQKVNDPNFKENMLKEVKNRQFIENTLLSPHDSRSAKLLDKILEEIDRKGRIKHKHRYNISFMISVQFLRTRRYRNQVIEMLEKTANAMISKGFFGEEYKDLEIYYLKEFETREHVASLTDYHYKDTMTRIFANHIWQIGVNKTKQPLYTSDNPIVIRGHIKNYNQGIGIASEGVEIAYPLTPKYILIMCERTAFRRLEKVDGRIKDLNEDNVIYYNSLQINQSHRQIYSCDSQFDLAIDICSKHPEICDPNRPQLIVT